MSHTNFHRKLKLRKPVPRKASKVIRPESIYDRNKEKVRWENFIKEDNDGF